MLRVHDTLVSMKLHASSPSLASAVAQALKSAGFEAIAPRRRLGSTERVTLKHVKTEDRARVLEIAREVDPAVTPLDL